MITKDNTLSTRERVISGRQNFVHDIVEKIRATKNSCKISTQDLKAKAADEAAYTNIINFSKIQYKRFSNFLGPLLK
jgi:hypothetical protein